MWIHMNCKTSGIEARGVSEMKSKNEMQDSIWGPLTSLDWFGAQLDVRNTVVLAFAKTSLAACNSFALGQEGASKSCTLA